MNSNVINIVATPANQTQTTCPYCGVGCGVLVDQTSTGQFTVKPNPEHPANKGRLCSKGMALAETIEHPDRLLHPQIDDQQVSWDTATSTIAQRIQQTIAEFGPDSVAFYVSGQLLTEDYYVANKLMKGYIGSANIDTNSRLCMSSAVAAHVRAFGEDIVPCSYQDIDSTDLILLVGSNAAWCHPVFFQRIVAAKKNNPNLKVINIDPRKTQTSDIADLHLPLKPGSDGFLFNGLLHYLATKQYHDKDFIQDHTEGLNESLKSAQLDCPDIAAVAKHCVLNPEIIEQFFDLFASNEKVLTVFSQGINQSSSGVDKANAMINCHLLTGRIGKPGAGPFSITGQPNAMGGREVGGLANQLAAHMSLDNPQHRELVQEFWGSPNIADKAGFKAVELFDAIHHGKVKLVWIMATNPAVSLPNTNKIREALARCPTVIVSDCVASTDTLSTAHIKLPATGWGERNGTVTNSERCISRQLPFRSPLGEAKHDWQIICAVAKKMGFSEHFNYPSSHDIFIEHAELSGYKNKSERCFDISSVKNLSKQDFDCLTPFYWPCPEGSDSKQPRLFSDGRFYTRNHRAKFIAVHAREPLSVKDIQHPFTFNTGRVRDHWHTLTRTGYLSRLSNHTQGSYVEIHPDDATHFDIESNSLVRIWNDQGEIHTSARISSQQQVGSLFSPIHWSDQFASDSVVCKLLPDSTDPLSGQPESKHATVQIEKKTQQWYGFILSRDTISIDAQYHWNKIPIANGWQTFASGEMAPEDWQIFSKELLSQSNTDQPDSDINWAEYFDTSKQTYRAARFNGERLESCIFIAKTRDKLPDSLWLSELLNGSELSPEDRRSLLSGRPAKPMKDKGRIICACFNVGEKTIREAIISKQLKIPEAIGSCLQAGTNCGSCIPELSAIIAECNTVNG